MKKVILCLAVIFMAVSIEVNAQTKYTPSPSSQIGKEWFVNNFIGKNKLKVNYDFAKTNDFAGPLSCIVLTKAGGDSAIVIFDYGGQSYLVKHYPLLIDRTGEYGDTYASIFNDAEMFTLEGIKKRLGVKEVLPLTHKNLLFALR